jgi:hypothetical protein
MSVVRLVGLGVAAAVMAVAGTPAARAQFFLKSKDLSGAPVVGDEPGIGQSLPGATKAEVEAALVWNMRAALNVAALQCQFEPTMVTVANYNALLTDHKDELKKSFDTLTKYFTRTNKVPKAGQTALDQFGTRTYASFATVAAQLNFCEVANDIGRDAVFAPRGRFAEVARRRTRELRNSLTPWGDQIGMAHVFPVAPIPRADPVCWGKKGDWVAKKCGPLVWPPAGVATAQR